MSDEITITTGRIARAVVIAVSAAVVTIALSIGSYKLGFYVALAGSYERQITKLEAQSAGLMALVGVVDQAKGREFMSCVESGRSDCMSIIAPVVTQ